MRSASRSRNRSCPCAHRRGLGPEGPLPSPFRRRGGPAGPAARRPTSRRVGRRPPRGGGEPGKARGPPPPADRSQDGPGGVVSGRRGARPLGVDVAPPPLGEGLPLLPAGRGGGAGGRIARPPPMAGVLEHG